MTDDKSSLALDGTSAQGEGSPLSYKEDNVGTDAERGNGDSGGEGCGGISWLGNAPVGVAVESVDASGGSRWDSVPDSSIGRAVWGRASGSGDAGKGISLSLWRGDVMGDLIATCEDGRNLVRTSSSRDLTRSWSWSAASSLEEDAEEDEAAV